MVDENRFERYDSCLDEVLDLLGLIPPERPSGEQRNDRQARRSWQGRAALMIMRVEENRAELRPLVTEVLPVAHARPDDTLVSRIRHGP
ncbi:hypothetical protein Rhe02_59110 [Rhizocola hellebori]|uniref:Uncharacterized protein n=1 Tax=Rhizocola hellebori TaxID=1392758 RepID=A0A8J3QBS0_9ACTN|nr:hypothetical protein [Rhizocola hellebori]GIH07844.1 hypothetical protein Rhe02_59110 [Rhizocola hellebori]